MPGFIPQTEENTFSIFKTDDDKRLVFGWASISITVDGEQLEDRQKDIIDPEDLEEAAYEYVLNFRDTGEEHISTMRKKGKLVESCVFTEEKQKAIGIPPGTVPIGWWVGFKIEDDAAWQKVKNGTYKMFSIEGKASREPVEKADKPKGCGVLVICDGKILAGTRIEPAGDGKICGPGGHIEEGETPEEAAIREAEEEFGIICRDIKPVGVLEGKDGKAGSAIFICTQFDNEPETDEKEMTSPRWLTKEELQKRSNLYPPFAASLALLPETPKATAKTFEDVLKFNPNHDSLGRFASASGGGNITNTGSTSYVNTKSYRCVQSGNDAISGYTGYAMFSDNPENIMDGYGDDMYMVDHADLTDINEIKPKIAEAWDRAVEDGTLPYELESYDADGETIAEQFDPEDIVDGAGAWDDIDLASWAFQEGIFDDISGVKTKDGAISWDSDKIKPTDKDAEVIGEEETTQKSARFGTTAQTFTEILKFNPYHDSRGRFSSANSYASFTTRTRDPKKQHWADMAAARLKQQAAAAQPATPPKPKKNYDRLGFADHDDADYHQLYAGRKYYQQQNLTSTQKAATTKYLEANPERGSLYSHSQNLNYKMAIGQQLTGAYKKTHDDMMTAMHNLGYNVNLTRYDHAGMVNGLLQTVGAGTDYEKMSASQIKKALVGQTISENKFLSTSYNNFSNAPASTKQIFDSRAVKINYKAKASVQAMMPGVGPGGDFGEIVVAPRTSGRITDVRLTGQMVRRKGTQTYNQPRIEIDIELG